MGSSVVVHVLAYSLLGATLVWGIIACAGDWAGGATLWGDFGDAKLNAIRAFLIIDIVLATASLGTAIGQRWLVAGILQFTTGMFSIIPWAIYIAQVQEFQDAAYVPSIIPFTLPPTNPGTYSPFDPYYDDSTTSHFGRRLSDDSFYQFGFVFAVLMTVFAIPATFCLLWIAQSESKEGAGEGKNGDEWSEGHDEEWKGGEGESPELQMASAAV